MHSILHILVTASGWIAAAAFIFNFATCFVMPWSKECKHKMQSDHGAEEESRPLCSYHTGIAWATIVAVSAHIILSLVYTGV